MKFNLRFDNTSSTNNEENDFGLNLDCMFRATSHTRLRAHDHYTTLEALSLAEKAEPVQVRFTLCLRDQWSM